MRSGRGYTIVELIFTIAMGAVLFTGVIIFTRQLVVNGVKSRDLVTAMNLARVKMSEAHNTAFTTIQPAGAAQGNYTLTALSDETGFAGYKCQRYAENLFVDAPSSTRLVIVEIRVASSADTATQADGRYLRPLATLTSLRHSATTFGEGVS